MRSSNISREGRAKQYWAFREQGAQEKKINCLQSHLRILVRDDGCGIDPQVLRLGRDGHWGLLGMRERAERIGARLNIRSRVTSGTEVELSVPGHIAFDLQSSDRPQRWIAKLYRGK